MTGGSAAAVPRLGAAGKRVDGWRLLGATAAAVAAVLGSGSTASAAGPAPGGVPAQPTFTGTNPPPNSSDAQPHILGNAAAGTTVTLYTNAQCQAPSVASGSATTFAHPGLLVTVAKNVPTSFYATASDAAGTSPCSSSSITYGTKGAATPMPVITARPASPSSNRYPTWSFTTSSHFSATCALTAAGSTIFAAARCSSPATYSLTGQPDGTYSFSVFATDPSNGVNSAPATSSFVLQTPAPPAATPPPAPTPPGSGTAPGGDLPAGTQAGTQAAPVATAGVPAAASAPQSTAPAGVGSVPSGAAAGALVAPGGSTFARTGGPPGVSASGAPVLAAGPILGFDLGIAPTIARPRAPAAAGTSTGLDLLGAAAHRVVFPLLLVLVVLAFLAVQDWIDRRDPKLALAPLDGDPRLAFTPHRRR